MWELNAILFGLASVAYVFLLVLLFLPQPRGQGGTTRTLLAAACALTAASACAIAFGEGRPLGPGGAILELMRTGSWCAFILYLLHRQLATRTRTIGLLSACGAVIAAAVVFTPFFEDSFAPESGSQHLVLQLSSRLAFAVFGILLVENLYRNTQREARWHIKLLCIGVGGMFCYSLFLYADGLLFRYVSPILWSGQAIVMATAAPLIAVAAARNRDWAIDIHVSREAVLHTATLLASGTFLLALAIAGEIFRAAGAGWGELAELTLVIGGGAVIAVLLTSGSARSYMRRLLAENFYSTRYDYRREWLKSIEILSTDVDRVAVQTRVIQAIAEIADSPAGVMWVREPGGLAFQWAGSWNHPPVPIAQLVKDPFTELFRDGSWIIELDRIAVRPSWLKEVSRAYLAVPLVARDLIGFVVLARPRAQLHLDGETFGLLRIVAKQSAIHIAEQQNSQALAEAKELTEYSRRFAFVIHDMKNVAGQLDMIVQNARFHANDPDFHKDVLATVGDALEKMNNLLARIRSRISSKEQGLIDPVDLIKDETDALGRLHRQKVVVEEDGGTGAVAIEEGAFRSVIRHLCENAMEASPERVVLRVHHSPSQVEVDVCDDGIGMDAEFVRDKLFRPLDSTKGDGFGIGAYQARELIRAAGGDILVMSRPNCGTTFRLVLPCSRPARC